MGFRLQHKSMTLNDLKRGRNGRLLSVVLTCCCCCCCGYYYYVTQLMTLYLQWTLNDGEETQVKSNVGGLESRLSFTCVSG